MYSDKFNKVREAAHIGEELLQSSPLSDVDRKCLVIKQCMQDGDFTLKEALELYQVSPEEFARFLSNEFLAELGLSVPGNQKLKVDIILSTIMDIYKRALIRFDNEAPIFLEHLNKLSKDVSEGKIAV